MSARLRFLGTTATRRPEVRGLGDDFITLQPNHAYEAVASVPRVSGVQCTLADLSLQGLKSQLESSGWSGVQVTVLATSSSECKLVVQGTFASPVPVPVDMSVYSATGGTLVRLTDKTTGQTLFPASQQPAEPPPASNPPPVGPAQPAPGNQPPPVNTTPAAPSAPAESSNTGLIVAGVIVGVVALVALAA